MPGSIARDPIVIVGGVVAGTAAAAAARREAPGDVPVILLERSPYVAYVTDSLPYEIADPLGGVESLERIVVATPADFRDDSGILQRVGHEAVELDCKRRRLRVRDHQEGREYTLDYGSVVLATGARTDTAHLSGLETEQVFAPRQLQDAIALRRYLEDERPRSALVVGGGKTGLALAESLRRLSLDVLVVERSAQLLPDFSREAGRELQREAERNGISVKTSVQVASFFHEDGRVVAHTTRGERLTADIALVATGLVPETTLAAGAGIVLGASGAIEVDHLLRTSAPRVFAAGECAEAFDRVSRRHRFHPLPTTSFKQGDVAGANAAGAHRSFRGIVGTQALRFFDVEAARTGLSRAALSSLGEGVLPVESMQSSGARAFARPGITTLLHVERATGRLLAAEMVGRGTVAKRIDVFATALAADLRVDEIASLDLTWAPPLAPVLDPVLVGARAAKEQSSGVVDRHDSDGEAFLPDV